MLAREARAVDPSLPAPKIERWIEKIRVRLMVQRMGAFLLVLFGAVALVVSAVGLYDLLAYVVAQRKAEIGIRLAIGASRRDVVNLVVGQGASVLADAGRRGAPRLLHPRPARGGHRPRTRAPAGVTTSARS